MEKELVMTRRIGCPHCGKQLTVTSEFAGKKVACPRCANQFRVTFNGGDVPSSVVEVAPRNPDLFPPNAPSGARPTSSASKAHSESTPAAAAPGSTQPAKAKPRFKEPPQQQSDADLQTARFIEPDVNATKVKLGEDGQLPDLALSDQEKQRVAAKESPSSNPLVLIAVLSASVVMSILILLIDEPSATTANDKAEARARVEAIYLSFDSWERQGPPARQLRDLLGHALQAYNRGDLEQEKDYYRQVLDLLNREDAPRYGGFSGNDKEVEDLVSELLR